MSCTAEKARDTEDKEEGYRIEKRFDLVNFWKGRIIFFGEFGTKREKMRNNEGLVTC